MTQPSAGEEADNELQNQNTWDRIRGLSQMEKILLAVKADRSERALLLQDNDREYCSRSFAILGLP